jgi:hypothetical protein
LSAFVSLGDGGFKRSSQHRPPAAHARCALVGTPARKALYEPVERASDKIGSLKRTITEELT